MPSYMMWNRALVAYLTEGIPRGMQVFLSVDTDLLQQVGRDLLGAPDEAVADFGRAVKAAVIEEDRITLTRVRGVDDHGEPRGVGFLAAMVLAATSMAEEEREEADISSINYFRRLRQVLGLPPAGGRPAGFEVGTEEQLWREWGQWLQDNGYVASARSGEGPRKYVDYPISQALLRSADKDRLYKLFAAKQLPTGWDSDMVAAVVQRDARYLTHHLQELLRAPGLRYTAVADAIYQVYEAWDSDAIATHDPGRGQGNRNLMTGLFRVEDVFAGSISYYLYPRTPRRRRVDHAEIEVHNQVLRLSVDRPGWFAPSLILSGEDLENGVRYKVTTPPDSDWLILPKRDFWVLMADPENQESDAFATWGTPQLGIPFMLLCRVELLPQLEHLRNERVLEWTGQPQPVLGTDGWVELQYCMAVSEAWSGIFIANQLLYEALRPKATISIGLSGGLRIPQAAAWVEGYGPQITIFGFEMSSDLQIKNVATDQVVFAEECQVNTSIAYPWPGPGTYLIEAQCGGETTVRLAKLIAWEEVADTPRQPSRDRNPMGSAVPTEAQRSTDSRLSEARPVIALGAFDLIGAHLVARDKGTS